MPKHHDLGTYRLSFYSQEADTATIELKEIDSVMVHEFLTYLYTSNYVDSGRPNNEDDKLSESERLEFNLGMYMTADRYGVNDLKELAREKFAAAIENGWSGDNLSDVVRTIYESTSSAADSELRKRLMSTLQKHKKVLRDNEDLMKIVKTHGEFAMDLIDAWGKPSGQEDLRLYCHIRESFGREGSVKCPRCKFGMNYCVM